MSHIVAIRLIACSIWIVCGLVQGGKLGYASAFAASMFMYTIIVENL